MEQRQCHEPGEPEQACQGVQGEYEPFVEEAAVGLVAAREDGIEEKVREGEEGEDSDADEVGGRGRGGGGAGVMEVPGCYFWEGGDVSFVSWSLVEGNLGREGGR